MLRGELGTHPHFQSPPLLLGMIDPHHITAAGFAANEVAFALWDLQRARPELGEYQEQRDLLAQDSAGTPPKLVLMRVLGVESGILVKGILCSRSVQCGNWNIFDGTPYNFVRAGLGAYR